MTVSLTVRNIKDPSLEVAESPVSQSPDASIVYVLDVSEAGDNPTAPAVVGRNLSTGQIVTAQILTGSPSVSDNLITLPACADLIINQPYQLDMLFTISGSTFERYVKIRCKDG